MLKRLGDAPSLAASSLSNSPCVDDDDDDNDDDDDDDDDDKNVEC